MFFFKELYYTQNKTLCILLSLIMVCSRFYISVLKLTIPMSPFYNNTA